MAKDGMGLEKPLGAVSGDPRVNIRPRGGEGGRTFHLVVAEDLLHPEAVHEFQQRENRGQVVSSEMAIPSIFCVFIDLREEKLQPRRWGEWVGSPKKFQIFQTNTHLEEKSVKIWGEAPKMKIQNPKKTSSNPFCHFLENSCTTQDPDMRAGGPIEPSRTGTRMAAEWLLADDKPP